ncbi:MAG: helix-turn-helix transcriptional regulator [Pseudomonadota bacterium]|nr:helix-turn-helix transcriptional regulator [Pseudomonadota bacterium]
MKEPNVHSVAAVAARTVEIAWSGGKVDRIDLSRLIADLAGLAGLADADTFAAAAVGEDGWSLIWPNGEEIGTDTLWRMAREQAGEATPIDEFSAWRVRNRLSQADAALALGITRRMVAYYEAGRYLIPRMVGLACRGWETEHREYRRHA